MHVNWIELAGYAASALVFLTFYMKTMIPLRVIGILSNIAFMTYAIGGRLYPVLILHAILLPLNCLRLVQMRALIGKVRDASRGDLSMEWLVPFARQGPRAKGEILFRKDDAADELYVVLSGSIRLVDVGVARRARERSGRSASSRPTISAWILRSARPTSTSGSSPTTRHWSSTTRTPSSAST